MLSLAVLALVAASLLATASRTAGNRSRPMLSRALHQQEGEQS
jgi:hypothetical protein